MKTKYEQINSKLILKYMAMIEDRTGLMMHQFDAQLESKCIQAIDGEIKASFVIAQLTKTIDQLSEVI